MFFFFKYVSIKCMYYPAAEIVFEAKPQIHVYVEQTLGYSSTSELLSVHSFLIF